MALKVIMLRHKLENKKQDLEQLRSKDKDFETRETELEAAINEAVSEEDEQVLTQEVEKFDEEKKAHEQQKNQLAGEIEALEAELENIELSAPNNDPEQRQNKSKEGNTAEMTTRKKFFGMSVEERSAFFANEEVKGFFNKVREMGVSSRSLTGAELGIPVVLLDVIRENIMDFSKLIRHVKLVPVNGTARQNVMGNIPEAVWTEACASLNELSLGISQVEVDGYKVGGIIYVCKAALEDNDINLAQEIISALGAAIGIAIDKAILYGTNKKMPLGIVTRLAQTSKPDDYSDKARPWQDLHTSNMINLGNKQGVELFKAIASAGGKAKGKYSRGGKFWAMNESTHNTLIVEAMNFNASGAIVSSQNGTMPVIGGVIEVLSDEIISDGNIVGGYGDLYLLAERSGAVIERSDEYRFADDLISFKGTARYDGEPIIAEAFVAMGINKAPQSSAIFAGDRANNALLDDLQIGGETLSPSFASTTFEYTIAVASAADANINASPAQAEARVSLWYEGKEYANGAKIKWKADDTAHPLTVTVKNGLATMVYTVNVTKASG